MVDLTISWDNHYMGGASSKLSYQVFPTGKIYEDEEWHHKFLSVGSEIFVWSMGKIQGSTKEVPTPWSTVMDASANVL